MKNKFFRLFVNLDVQPTWFRFRIRGRKFGNLIIKNRLHFVPTRYRHDGNLSEFGTQTNGCAKGLVQDMRWHKNIFEIY